MRLWLVPVLTLCAACSAGPAIPYHPTPIQPELINGTVVPPGERPDIVNIRTGNAGCTASVVGKRVVLTAAHCASTGATSTFKTNGKSYTGKAERSPLYQGKDHDIAVIVTTEDIDLGGKPYSVVGGTAAVGKEIQIYGYGCTQPGGGGGNDGQLRTGKASITGFSNFDIVSKNGSALCYGDSGGPAYIDDAGKLRQISVNSKGNISTTNYTTRTDVEESKKFFEDMVAKYKVEICGVNATCDGGPPPPPPPGQFTLKSDAVEVTVKNLGKFDDAYLKNVFLQAVNYLDKQAHVLPGPPPADPVHPVQPEYPGVITRVPGGAR